MYTDWTCGVSILGQQTLDSIGYLLCNKVSVSDLIKMSVDEINYQADELRQQIINDEQSLVLSTFKRRFPNSTAILYKGYVFHGQYQIFDKIDKGLNIFMGDVSDILMKLWDVGVIDPKRFCPSHSGAAFLGLSYSTRGSQNDKPTHDNAAHWEWEVIRDVQFELTLDEILTENELHTGVVVKGEQYEKHILDSNDSIVFTGTASKVIKWLRDQGVEKKTNLDSLSSLDNLDRLDNLESNILRWMILDNVAGSHPHPGCEHDILDYESAEKARMKITSMAGEKEIRQVSEKVIDEIVDAAYRRVQYEQHNK